jgi:hypothetical protein
MQNAEKAVRHLLGLDDVSIIIRTVPFVSYNSKGRFFFDKPLSTYQACFGIQTQRLGQHIILLSEAECNTEALAEATLAHELVHVWQWEALRPARQHHGRRDYFQQWGKKIFEELGIVI